MNHLRDSTPTSFQSDPATWSRAERIDQYRVQSARYKRIAEEEARACIRDRLLKIASQCDGIAEELGRIVPHAVV